MNKSWTLLIINVLLVACGGLQKKEGMASEEPACKPLVNQEFREAKIGNLVWMAENLNVDQFCNGINIQQATSKAEWLKLGEEKKAAWCYYNFDPVLGKTYGKLYNWYAVSDSRGLAPFGWHIPSDAEWIDLIKNLGENPGVKLKSQEGWRYKTSEFSDECLGCPEGSGNGTNESGFAGLPSGVCEADGAFGRLSEQGHWWSSTDLNDGYGPYVFYLNFIGGEVERAHSTRHAGLSVRCVRNYDSK